VLAIGPERFSASKGNATVDTLFLAKTIALFCVTRRSSPNFPISGAFIAGNPGGT
jgi:hypothetical protein